ncbi:glycosyltransferase family 2 protein [Microbacterium sp. HD4P20]|uniref:glycosyltransferase family 2 protein n=1 Tax=Microbacterium sp. HD4P20 TaxID=2864874 RepID=UPI0020A2D414|nr:glycosyltransferase family A protein [Microbacterium sp. HD4P20]MCP2637524.1 glycosyltransferase family 2 protein [Microbacterium sp. HD4P20]
MSIVIRTKNRAQLLRRALDDILAQTFHEWHLTVVNDGGESAPVDKLVAERKSTFAGRVDVIHVEGGTGSMEAAANLGAQRARGDFVIIHDDDDTWASDFLAVMVDALDADQDAIAATARTEIVFERIDGGRVVEMGRSPFVPPGEMVTIYDLLQTNRVVPISLLVRRAVYDEIGWYDPILRAVGDWEFNLRLVRHGRVIFVGDEPLAFWHQRPHATGPASNSVFGESLEHLQFDRMVRDRELRDYIDRNGIGGLLYLSKYIEETARYYSLQQTIRRAAARVVDKVRIRRRS